MASIFSNLNLGLRHKNIGVKKSLFNKRSKSPMMHTKIRISGGPKMKSPIKRGGISPSIGEFERMMSSASSNNYKSKKKFSFGKK